MVEPRTWLSDPNLAGFSWSNGEIEKYDLCPIDSAKNCQGQEAEMLRNNLHWVSLTDGNEDWFRGIGKWKLLNRKLLIILGQKK